MSIHSQTEPLIPSKLSNEQTADPLPKSNATVIKALAAMRIAVGVAALIAPRWSCALFQFPIPATYSVMPRLIGVRDLVIGELLITAENKEAHDGGRREIKRALWAGIANDCMDVASILVGLATGTLGKMPAIILGSSTASWVVLGVLGVRGL